MLELRQASVSGEIDDQLYAGFYPRIFDQNLNANEAYNDCFATYVERDVARTEGIGELGRFETFVRLCASYIGQVINFSKIASATGISHSTAKRWFSILQRSFIAFELRPYFANIKKRLVKSPKLYFYDVGLASYLLRIRNSDQIAFHSMRGALFENAVIVEALKHGFNRGFIPEVYFYRDSNQIECDLPYRTNSGFGLIGIKSSSTIPKEFFRSLDIVANNIPNVEMKAVVYAGTDRQIRTNGEVVPLLEFNDLLNRLAI